MLVGDCVPEGRTVTVHEGIDVEHVVYRSGDLRLHLVKIGELKFG